MVSDMPQLPRPTADADADTARRSSDRRSNGAREQCAPSRRPRRPNAPPSPHCSTIVLADFVRWPPHRSGTGHRRDVVQDVYASLHAGATPPASRPRCPYVPPPVLNALPFDPPPPRRRAPGFAWPPRLAERQDDGAGLGRERGHPLRGVGRWPAARLPRQHREVLVLRCSSPVEAGSPLSSAWRRPVKPSPPTRFAALARDLGEPS